MKNQRIPNVLLPSERVTVGDEPEGWIGCPWCDHKFASEDQLDQHLMDNSEVWPHPELEEEHLESAPTIVRCSCGEAVESGEPLKDHIELAGEHGIVSIVEVLE
jgi:hypothetical protein